MPGNITLCEHIRTNMIIIFQLRLMPFIFMKRFETHLGFFAKEGFSLFFNDMPPFL